MSEEKETKNKEGHHHIAGSGCCETPTNPSVCQTLGEMDFERGIWQAALDDNAERISHLVSKQGVKPDATDSYGYTALHYAARNGNMNAAKCLIQLGANLNCQTRNNGATPLHRAIIAKKLGMIQYLLKCGADINLKDNDGHSCMGRAVLERNDEVGASRWASETELFLSFIIWKFSVFDKNCTVGQRLLGLEYFYGKRKLIQLFILDHVLPYLHRKISKYTPNYKTAWSILENCLKAFQLFNLLAFLFQNRYPSLNHRLARLGMRSISSNAQSSVGYSYQIRELLWHQFADTLLIVLPFVNLRRVMSYFSKPVPKLPGPSDITTFSESDQKCCICLENPVIPTQHENSIFCYYCLRVNELI